MKYPNIVKDKEEFLMVPLEQSNKRWKCAILQKNGVLLITGISDHLTEESCLVCCKAHNDRVGYTGDKITKILKKYSDGEKNKKAEGESKKGKKGKKGKKVKEKPAKGKKAKKGKKGKKGDKDKKRKSKS